MTYLRTPLARWSRLGLGVGLVLFAAACGDDDDDVVAPTPTIAVAAGTATVNVTAGQNGTSAITITRNGGYTGAVALTVTGAPAGVTATFNPTSVASGATTSTLTLATTAATAAGTYPLVVTASGTGVTSVTTPVSLVVTAPAPAAGFTVPATAAVSVTQGAAAQTATIAITRTGGFAGAVTLATSGTIPAGLTVTPAAATTGTSATVAVSATAAVAPGTYPITINATGAGVTGTQTTTLTVTVAAAQAAQDFSIGATAVSIAAGATAAGTSTVTITRTGGFAGAVTLTTTGAPAGVTVTAPAATTGNTASITVAAAANAAPGTYPITVSATGAGVTGTKTTTFNVTVTPAVQVGDFTVAVTPTTVTLQQGQTATVTATLTRTGGLTGPIDVTVTGLPAGVTAQITSSLLARQSPLIRTAAEPITGNTATIRLTATTGAPTGAFSFNVVASAPNIPAKTTAVTGTITAANTGGGNVGLSFCAAEAPLWVGFQNDGGAWQRATIGANNQVQVNITGARGAIAFVTSLGTGEFQTSVVYGTATELNSYGANACATVAGGKTHTGTIAGAGATDQVAITLGDASADVATGNASFTINDVSPGPRDLLAVRSALVIGGGGFSITPNRIFLRRDVNVANGASLGTIDFNGADSFAPATAQLTVSGLAAGEALIPFVSLQTATGTSAAFFTGFGGLTGGGTGPQTYYGLPTDRLRATDYHLLTAIAFPSSGQTPDQTQGRISATFFRTVAARTLTLSAALSTPTVSIVAGPYPRPRVQLARQADYADAMTTTFSQGTASTTRAVAMTALASFLQGGTTWDLTFPDLSAAPGFDVNWMLRAGTATQWTAQAAGGSGITLVGQTPTEGSAFRAAFRSGTINTLLRAIRR